MYLAVYNQYQHYLVCICLAMYIHAGLHLHLLCAWLNMDCSTQYTAYKQRYFCPLEGNWLGNTHRFFLRKCHFCRKKKWFACKQIRRKSFRMQSLPASPVCTLLKVGGTKMGSYTWYKCSHMLLHKACGELDEIQNGSLNNLLSTSEMQRRGLSDD